MTKKERSEILTILSILEEFRYSEDKDYRFLDDTTDEVYDDPLGYVCFRLRTLYNKSYKPQTEKQKADIIDGDCEILA